MIVSLLDVLEKEFTDELSEIPVPSDEVKVDFMFRCSSTQLPNCVDTCVENRLCVVFTAHPHQFGKFFVPETWPNEHYLAKSTLVAVFFTNMH